MSIIEELKTLGVPDSAITQILHDPDESTKINKLSDESWLITHPTTLAKTSLDWSEAIPLATTIQLIMFKQLMRDAGKSEHDGSLFIKNHMNHIDLYRWLTFAINNLNRKNIQRLSDLTPEDVMNIIVDTVKKRVTKKTTVAAHSTVEKRWHLLSKISEGYLSRILIDGFNEIPSYKSVINALQPIVSSETDWAEWLAEGSYGSVPLPIASLYLKESIDVIRSINTKWYEFITNFVRANEAIPQGFLYRVVSRSEDGWVISRTGVQSPLMKIFISEARVFFKLSGKKKLPKFPFKNGDDLENYSFILHGAAQIIFLSLTGARRSEVISIKNGDLIKQNNGTYKFRSEIKKTNDAIPTLRDIAGLAAEAYDAIKSVKLHQDSSEDGNIFEQSTFTWSHFLPKTIKHGSYQRLPVRLQRFALHIEKKYGAEFYYSDKIAPHQFRHTFAEFALRRFDGNVLDAIRNHFRHSYNSFMTGRYIRRKIYEGLEEQDTDFLSDLLAGGSTVVREYIGELIQRAKNGEKLYGATGQWIVERVKLIEFLDPKTLNEIIDEFDGELSPHEYGICLIRKETKMQAKCFDKVSGTANTDEARWGLCGNCVNRLSLPNNKDAIMRIGMKSQVHAESFKKAGLITIANLEESNIKTAMAALAEIENGEKINV